MANPPILTHRHVSPQCIPNDEHSLKEGDNARCDLHSNRARRSSERPDDDVPPSKERPPRRDWRCRKCRSAAANAARPKSATASFAFLIAAYAAAVAAGVIFFSVDSSNRPRPRVVVLSDALGPSHRTGDGSGGRGSDSASPLYVLGRQVLHEGPQDSSRSSPLIRPEMYYFERGNCVAMREWQRGHHPTCNAAHEVDLTEYDTGAGRGGVQLVNNGDYRDVWRISGSDGTTPRAMKTLRYMHDYTHRLYAQFRHEAVAMEHLTKSPYIVDIYGHCAVSALYDFGGGGTIKKKAKKGRFTPMEKLSISLQVAHAVADVHDLDNEGVITMAITDVSSRQFVMNDDTGIYQLMDMNLVKLMTWDADSHALCPFKDAPGTGFVRSPEEYAQSSAFTEKIDIWALGNIIHYLLARGYPFCTPDDEDCELEDVVSSVQAGIRPPSYDKIKRKGDPIEVALLRVVKKTRRMRPEDRWKAREVVGYLEGVMKNFTATLGPEDSRKFHDGLLLPS